MNTIKLCNPKAYARSGYRRTTQPARTLARKGHGKTPRVRRTSHLLVQVTVTITLMFLFASWGADEIRAQKAALTLSLVPSTQITVGTGDSLWAIASAHPVDGVSTPELVDWLKDQNDLTGAVLALGQTLTVPDAGQQRLANA